MEAAEAAERAGRWNGNGPRRRSCLRLGQTSGGRGAKGGPGEETSWLVSKDQVRTVDPGMEASETEQPLQARERPIREVGSVEKENRGEPRGGGNR